MTDYLLVKTINNYVKINLNMAEANEDTNAAYAPTYITETDGLPVPGGIYGKEIHSTIAVQINEAQLFLNLIVKSQDPVQYLLLARTLAPMTVLVKVRGEGRVKMLLRVASYEADPFITPKPPINGKFLLMIQKNHHQS